jgi:hypothetical protein
MNSALCLFDAEIAMKAVEKNSAMKAEQKSAIKAARIFYAEARPSRTRALMPCEN